MKRLTTILCLTLAVLLGGESISAAQTNCFSKENFAKYQKLKTGQFKLDALSSTEKKCIFLIHNTLSRSNAPKDTSECQDAWDQANSAEDDVASAAKRLIRCVEGSDHRFGHKWSIRL